MGFLDVKKELTPETVIQRKPGLLFNEIDGEIVMLSVANSEYYGMDKVGSRIWELIENPVILKDLINTLLNEYNVGKEQCSIETLTFLEKLWNKKLINVDFIN